jgi:hypothetical protein
MFRRARFLSSERATNQGAGIGGLEHIVPLSGETGHDEAPFGRLPALTSARCELRIGHLLAKHAELLCWFFDGKHGSNPP